jgi:branched-chain amino acid transport system ATP-binding protein
LSVRHLSKSFGGVRAVDQVSFDLEPGEALALLGPNGAGKSTCFNLLNGQLRPDAGSIRFEGRELIGMHPRQIWRLGIGRTFQIGATFASLTVLENVQIALVSRERAVFGWPRELRDFHRDEASELLKLVGMHSQSDRPCGVLAYGDVKRVELALALSNRPRLLLMDEPTAGMGPGERVALMELARRLVVEQRIAVLFTEHNMDAVFSFADRMLVLARGQLIAQGDGQTIRNDPKVQEVYFGSGKTFDVDTHEGRLGVP